MRWLRHAIDVQIEMKTKEEAIAEEEEEKEFVVAVKAIIVLYCSFIVVVVQCTITRRVLQMYGMEEYTLKGKRESSHTAFIQPTVCTTLVILSNKRVRFMSVQ